jgi:threonylcarbamoyladenosine tRNA methylthiotransferase MtaB
MTDDRQGPRVAIATLGCKVNAYDTATMADRPRRGLPAVEPGAPADVVIVNSCTVTDTADAEPAAVARAARESAARVILTGCYAQTQPRAAAAVEAVDYVIGLNRLDALVEAVTSSAPRGPRRGPNSRRETAVETFGARTFDGQTRAS